MAEKKKKKKRRKKHYLLKFFLFIIICAGLIYFARSSVFDISAVQVADNSYYTTDQIIQLTGVEVGDNMYTFRTRTIEQKLLKQPYIQSVKVKRKLPDKLQIIVKERVECAFVKFEDKYYILDNTGHVLKEEKETPALTEIVDAKVQKAKVGNALEAVNNSMLNKSLKMLGTATRNEVNFKKLQVKSVVVDAYLNDKLIVRGDPEDIKACIKSKKLTKVIYKLYKDGTKKGLIRVGEDNYCTYSKTIK